MPSERDHRWEKVRNERWVESAGIEKTPKRIESKFGKEWKQGDSEGFRKLARGAAKRVDAAKVLGEGGFWWGPRSVVHTMQRKQEMGSAQKERRIGGWVGESRRWNKMRKHSLKTPNSVTAGKNNGILVRTANNNKREKGDLPQEEVRSSKKLS